MQSLCGLLYVQMALAFKLTFSWLDCLDSLHLFSEIVTTSRGIPLLLFFLLPVLVDSPQKPTGVCVCVCIECGWVDGWMDRHKHTYIHTYMHNIQELAQGWSWQESKIHKVGC